MPLPGMLVLQFELKNLNIEYATILLRNLNIEYAFQSFNFVIKPPDEDVTNELKSKYGKHKN